MPLLSRSAVSRGRHSFPAAPTRLAGFLSLDRRILAFGSIGFAAALVSVPALPAEANSIVATGDAPAVQGFAAPYYLPATAPRDGFDVSLFSLVQWPVPANTTMTSGYGYRSCDGCSSDHKGIDLTPGLGHPVQAVADGVVITSEEASGGLGVNVVLEHVIDGEVTRTVYGHMEFGSLQVEAGQTVTRGQQIGTVGNTGSSTGPHLHFEVIIDDVQINPLPWLIAHANS
ncbi:murein DD-endopeptidase MepM/ murein hydrolase activator NlpD [Leifsonia sp. AK011]|uniref:M23 family metallopeptidase n=1 Tax=Leifsonia sp. AK011 TaxID=2723075 RepID=UPI0015CE96EC|nr:M23 family metallopeptidase [Leifsonia sp. AK011]NYF11123.1 murein DD-endopeptidase MepM/ murein hydrolase activator NlpD [Leifsonia sp. AK011]